MTPARIAQTEQDMRVWLHLQRRDVDVAGWIMVKQVCSRRAAERRLDAVLAQYAEPDEPPPVTFRKWMERNA